MDSSGKQRSKSLKISAAILVLIFISLGIFTVLTYPRTLVTFPVSFTIGASVERREFEVPLLHEWVQVEITINSGTALWTANIASQDDTLWNHAAHQGGQTIYRSEWVKIGSGRYNFTFAITGGLSSLEAEIKVISKGRFW